MYPDDALLSFDEDSTTVTFCRNEMTILSLNRSNINLNDARVRKMILILFFLSEFCLSILNLKDLKHLKKS